MCQNMIKYRGFGNIKKIRKEIPFLNVKVYDFLVPFDIIYCTYIKFKCIIHKTEREFKVLNMHMKNKISVV